MAHPDIKLAILDAFRRYDANGDGVISRDTLARVLAQLGCDYLQDGDIELVLNVTAGDRHHAVEHIVYEDLVDWITSPSNRSPDALSRCSTTADSMSLTRERHDAEARAGFDSLVVSLQSRLQAVAPAACTHGHPLERLVTTSAGYVCDACRRPLAQNCTISRCRACNYDLCEVCAEVGQVAALSRKLTEVRAWLRGAGAVAERDEIEASRCVLESAAERTLSAIEKPLTAFFERAYFEGHVYEGARYRIVADQYLHESVLEHGATGIRVWPGALDLRPHHEQCVERDFVVLYWYTDATGVARLTHDRADHTAVMCTGARGPSGHFGPGIYATSQEPNSFPSKEAVLFNNHWPRAGECDVPASQCLEAGPQHAGNRAVCEWLVADEQRRALADYCVPLIVSEAMAFNIWERLPPDLAGWCPGCNRWNEKQWPGRDVWVIQAGSAAPVDLKHGKVHVARRHMEHLKATKGPQHPETLASITELAWLLRNMGEHKEAEPLFRQELRASEELFGPTHPDTLTSVDNLAGVLKAMGIFDEAETLYRRALEGSIRALGPHHEDTLTSTNNLAGLLKNIGKLEEAEAFYRQALSGSQETLGHTHPDTLTSMYNLAGLLQARSFLAEAEKLYRAVLSGREEVLGASDIRTLRSASSLATLLESTGRRDEAEHLFCRAFTSSYGVLGPANAETVLHVGELADFFDRTGRTEEALRLRAAASAELSGSRGA